jgi:hypothetical protein
MSQPIIQADGVTKTFGKGKRALTAVEDFDLLVNSREVVTLVGPSGCGKSTVLNMVAGFMPPSSGRILLEGTPVTKVEPHCGMIFQTYALFPWMTVQENVEFGPRVNRLPKPERLKRAGRYIEMVGLVDFENAYPKQSPGQRTGGAALRRALCSPGRHDPPGDAGGAFANRRPVGANRPFHHPFDRRGAYFKRPDRGHVGPAGKGEKGDRKPSPPAAARGRATGRRFPAYETSDLETGGRGSGGFHGIWQLK